MKKFLKLYFRTVKLALKYKWYYLATIISSILLLFFNNYSTYRLKDVVNAIQSGQDIVMPLIIIGLVISAPIILEPATFYPRGILYARVVGDIMHSLYKKVMSLDYAFHTDKETGKIVSKIINSDAIPNLFLWQFEYFIWDNFAAFFIPTLIVFSLSFQIGLLIICVLLVIIPFQIYPMKQNIKKRYDLKEIEYSRNSAIIDGITNYETVRTFARKHDEINYLTELIDKNIYYSIQYQNTFRLIDVTSRIGGIALFAIGSYGVWYLRSSLDAGSIVVIISYLIQISNKVMNFIFSLREIVKNLPIIEDTYALLDEKSKISEPKEPKEISIPKGHIKYNKICFEYNKGKKVISDISMDIKAGATIALVGPSGGGKSTLIRLLLRYYDVDKGSITVDGYDLRDLGTDNINELVGVVPQEPILFNRSLKYNIGYALSPK
ncbi:MAG TPA: ABC transporter ATP-binding protein, partial [Candidatus Dojkabacteria bacterium]|nr:ABC transporter ATP-binding protein [Candidatus Dojkabacteria bacterium]